MANIPQKWAVAVVLGFLAALAPLAPALAQASKPPVSKALGLKPTQADVEYDVPDAATADKCTLETYKSGKVSGWEVRDPDGNVLRRYLDTNADNKVDQWCYFKNGIEVYRDIDSNFKGNADQYRWLGTAGMRWAIDEDEDGKPDSWKAISPEEVSEEVVLALSTKDVARFKRLLLTPEELRNLQLGDGQGKQLAKKIADSAAGFEELFKRPDIVSRDSHWVNFGGTRPGVVPAGTDGAQRDLVVYENAVAVVETGGTHSQVLIGTLVQTGNVWRLIDLPKTMADSQASSTPDGFFFLAILARRAEADVPVAGLSSEVQQLINQMEQIDKDLGEPKPPAELAALNARRADVLEKLAEKTTQNEERVSWIHQLADTVSAAAQSGAYPEGIDRLNRLWTKLGEQKESLELVAYTKFRYLSAAYMQSLQQDNADFAKIQDKWLADLQQFVTDFATTPDAADAMLQLAMAEEFAGDDAGAVKWYTRIATEFPGTQLATKASGAQRRIESVGQILTLAGKDLQGNAVDIASYRGKVVLVHFWATWSVRGRPDTSVLKDMQTKYGKDNVAIVGVNVDNDQAELNKYLAENNLPWPQLYAPGGLDSPLATAYGILVLPTMMLAGQDGKVISRDLTAGEVDNELRKLLR